MSGSLLFSEQCHKFLYFPFVINMRFVIFHYFLFFQTCFIKRNAWGYVSDLQYIRKIFFKYVSDLCRSLLRLPFRKFRQNSKIGSLIFFPADHIFHSNFFCECFCQNIFHCKFINGFLFLFFTEVHFATGKMKNHNTIFFLNLFLYPLLLDFLLESLFLHTGFQQYSCPEISHHLSFSDLPIFPDFLRFLFPGYFFCHTKQGLIDFIHINWLQQIVCRTILHSSIGIFKFFMAGQKDNLCLDFLFSYPFQKMNSILLWHFNIT